MVVDFGQLLEDMFFGMLNEVSYGGDLLGGPLGGGFHGIEKVENPSFPVVVFRDASQESVVVCLGAENVAAEIEDGQGKKALLNEVEDVDNASCATVAIFEGVNGFELIVSDCHFDKRVETVFVVEKLFPIGEQVAEKVFAFGRSVGDLAGSSVRELGTRPVSYRHRTPFYDAANFYRRVRVDGAFF